MSPALPLPEPVAEAEPDAVADPDPVAEPDPVAVADPEPVAVAVADPEPVAVADPVVADPDPDPCPAAVSSFLQALVLINARARSIIAVRMQYPPPGMLRRFRGGFICAWLAIASAAARADPPIQLPPGSRAEADHYVSGRGPRDTSDFIAKQLAHAGIAATQVGPYRVRGVDVTRFVATDAASALLAVHVVRVSGKTLIFFVPRPKP
ncbi:MAG TPA: hypothetical protein VMJ10_35870 [Kofleriaceae bacterium]|nr:hypothetical protein [Kofleriaceae bacterium]